MKKCDKGEQDERAESWIQRVGKTTKGGQTNGQAREGHGGQEVRIREERILCAARDAPQMRTGRAESRWVV